MAVHVWHLVVPRERQPETDTWVVESRILAPCEKIPRKDDVVFLRDPHKGAFLVGRFLDDARLAALGVIEAPVRWVRIPEPRILMGAPRGAGLRRMHGHSWEHRIEAQRWLDDPTR
jgi:hypothetical protein